MAARRGRERLGEQGLHIETRLTHPALQTQAMACERELRSCRSTTANRGRSQGKASRNGLLVGGARSTANVITSATNQPTRRLAPLHPQPAYSAREERRSGCC